MKGFIYRLKKHARWLVLLLLLPLLLVIRWWCRPRPEPANLTVQFRRAERTPPAPAVMIDGELFRWWNGIQVEDIETPHLRNICAGLERGRWSWGAVAKASPDLQQALEAELKTRNDA